MVYYSEKKDENIAPYGIIVSYTSSLGGKMLCIPIATCHPPPHQPMVIVDNWRIYYAWPQDPFLAHNVVKRLAIVLTFLHFRFSNICDST